MNIVKAQAQTYLKRNTIITYDIKVYFDDGTSSTYTIDERIRYKANVQKGRGEAKIKKFLDTQEGLQWIYDYINNKLEVF